MPRDDLNGLTAGPLGVQFADLAYNPGNYNPTTSPVYYHNVKSINPEFFWLIVCGGCFCFVSAFSIGANDTANNWGSSIGAKAISVRAAAICAVIFEATGAFALGANVGGTLKTKIVDPKYYCDDNYGLATRMVGMCCSDLSAFIWVMIATYYGVPVSTTHAVVGAICGFGIITRGWDLIVWWETMGKIFISWASSPLLSAFCAFCLQAAVRLLLFRGPPGSIYRKNHLWLPVVAGLYVGLAVTFAVFIGGKSNDSMKALGDYWFAVIWAGVTTFAIIALVLIARMLRKWANIDLDAFKDVEPRMHNDVKDETMLTSTDDFDMAQEGGSAHRYSEEQPAYPAWPTAPNTSPYSYPEHGAFNEPTPMYASNAASYNASYPAVAPESNAYGTHPAPVPSAATFINNKPLEGKKDIWDGVTEEEFASQQLWIPLCWAVACTESLAHGANDVGNALGPYSAMWDAYQGKCPGTKIIDWWMLGMGAGGIVLGVVLYGHNVIRTLGVKITRITPQKSATAECGAVICILIATALAIPVSTTHCSVGAIAGMGLYEGGIKNVEWGTLLMVAEAILFTVPSCAMLCAGMFGFWQAAIFGAAYPGPSAFNATCNATFPGPW